MAEYGVLPHWIDIYIISSKQGGRTPRYSTAKTPLCLSIGGGGRPLRGVLVLRGTPLERKNARDLGAEEIPKKNLHHLLQSPTSTAVRIEKIIHE